MEFSNQQKLIITLLTDLHAHLGVQNSVDPEFVQRMVNSGQGWALGWAYPGMFEDGVETPDEVRFVGDVLSMRECIEETYAGYDAAAEARLEELAPVFGKAPRFKGFDGNNEPELRGIVQILVDDLDRFSTFKGRDTNSHSRTAEAYQRMVEVYERLLGNGFDFNLTVEDLAELLNAQIHPDNR